MTAGTVGVKQSASADRLIDNLVVLNEDGDLVYRQRVGAYPASAVSDSNSVLATTLGAGATWLGQWEDVTGWALITYAHNGVPVDAAGTVAFEFSFDGSQVDVTAGALPHTGVGLSAPHTLIPVARWFRLRYVNGSTPLTDFRLQTVLHSSKSAKLTRFPVQTLTDYDDVDFTRAIVAGKNRFGNYANVALTDRNAFSVEDSRLEVGTFGELATSSRVEEIAVSYDQDTLANSTSTVTGGGGSAVVTNSQLRLATGAAATASAQVTSREVVRYRPGHEIAAMFTAAWPTAAVTGSAARIGLFDDNDGFWIGYNGPTFGVAVRRGGVDTFTARAGFNEDLLTGEATSNFQRGGTPEPIDLATVNVFRINFGWLGSAPAAFEILSPDGHWVVFHHIRQPNTSVDVHILNPNLPIRAEVTKTSADSTDLKMRTGSWSGSVRGVGYVSAAIKSNSTTTSLGANATFAGIWENCEHHVSLAVNITADQNSASDGIRIDFSDDANTVRRTETFSYSGPAGVAFVVATPAKFFRVRYTNGGTAQGSFSMLTVLHVTALQQPQAALTAAIGDATNAGLVRSVLTGKSNGSYTNVKTTTGGSLKVDLAESSGEIAVRSLTGFSTNQASVTATASQIVGSPLTNRRSVTIKAHPGNTKTIFLGTSSAVSSGNGFPLAAGDSVDLEVDTTPNFWVVAESGTQTVTWLEVAK